MILFEPKTFPGLPAQDLRGKLANQMYPARNWLAAKRLEPQKRGRFKQDDAV